MKITKRQLRRIIREEVGKVRASRIVKEGSGAEAAELLRILDGEIQAIGDEQVMRDVIDAIYQGEENGYLDYDDVASAETLEDALGYGDNFATPEFVEYASPALVDHLLTFYTMH